MEEGFRLSCSRLQGLQRTDRLLHVSLNLETKEELGRASHRQRTEPEDHHQGQELAWPCHTTLTVRCSYQKAVVSSGLPGIPAQKERFVAGAKLLAKTSVSHL